MKQQLKLNIELYAGYIKTAPNVTNQESLTTDKEWFPSLASDKQLLTTKKNHHFTECYTDLERSFERPKQCTMHVRIGNVTLRRIG